MPSKGWYDDSTGRHRLRYWDGREWTSQAVDVDPLAIPPGTAPCETGAGWAYDPTGRYGLRYFDGTAWTSHVVLDEAGASVMATPGPPSPMVSWGAVAARESGARERAECDVVLAFLADAARSRPCRSQHLRGARTRRVPQAGGASRDTDPTAGRARADCSSRSAGDPSGRGAHRGPLHSRGSRTSELGARCSRVARTSCADGAIRSRGARSRVSRRRAPVRRSGGVRRLRVRRGVDVPSSRRRAVDPVRGARGCLVPRPARVAARSAARSSCWAERSCRSS